MAANILVGVRGQQSLGNGDLYVRRGGPGAASHWTYRIAYSHAITIDCLLQLAICKARNSNLKPMLSPSDSLSSCFS